jgi:hypothetical protein
MTGRNDKRPAIERSEQGAQAWHDVVRHQRNSPADHADFYALAGDMVATLHALDDLAGVLRRQIVSYVGQPGLYDDTRRIDPAQRLTQAHEELTAARTALVMAAGAVNRFWSAIGHIGIEAQP